MEDYCLAIWSNPLTSHFHHITQVDLFVKSMLGKSRIVKAQLFSRDVPEEHY